MKRILSLGLALMLLIMSAGCTAQNRTAPTSTKKPLVFATFYPMYFLTERIGGDKVQIETLIPPGVEPHDWEPSPKTLASLSQASLLVANGLDMEPWLADLSQVAPDTKVLKVSERLSTLENGDPHVWLDPLMTQKMARKVTEALVDIDAANKSYYETNLQKLNQDLAELDQAYVKGLAQVQSRNLVVSHEAFGYLAARYNLNQVALRGLDPDAEPTPAKMAELVDYCKDNHIKYIFYEELINPKVSEILAKEVGAKTLSLNPLESLSSTQAQQQQDYLTVMRENLAHLQQGLQ